MALSGLIISTLGIVLLVSTHSALADPIDDAVDADRRGDFRAALAIIRPLVDQGDSTAEAILREMYTNGHAGRVDFQEAERLVFQSVRKGDREGRAFLGLMYKNGWGVQKDELAAAYWSELSSNNSQATETPAPSASGPPPDSPAIKHFKAYAEMMRGLTRGQIAEYTRNYGRNSDCITPQTPQSLGATALFRAPSGTLYKYNLNDPSDQLKYQMDLEAQLQDSINPQVSLDRSMGVNGGGALKQ